MFHNIMPYKDPIKAREYNTKYRKEWRQKHLEYSQDKQRVWQQENRDKTRGYSKKYYNLNREKEIARIVVGNINRYRKMRLDALIHYGGDPPICSCCKETEYLFLTIHHMKNDGAQHRKDMKKKYSWGIYEFLKRNNYPDGYGVMCYNCNSAIGHYGRCPHE